MAKKGTTTKKETPTAQVKIPRIEGQDANKNILKVAVDNNITTMLIGETGTGKTSMVKELADEHGKTLIRVNLNGQTTVDDFIGKWIIVNKETKWIDGILLEAMKNGNWIVCDEVNAALPEILFVLHSLLDDDRKVVVVEHAGEIVHPHPDFRFFATMNPYDEYAGTKELNKAFLSRFGIVMTVEYPDSMTEKKILEDRCGVSAGEAATMADFAFAARKLKKNGDIWATVSTRDLIQWGTLVSKIGMKDAFISAVLNKGRTEDHDKLIEALQKVNKSLGKLVASLNEPTLKSVEETLHLRLEQLEKKEKAIQKEQEKIKQMVLEKLGKDMEDIVDEVLGNKVEEVTAAVEGEVVAEKELPF